jgi:hypothetical protein
MFLINGTSLPLIFTTSEPHIEGLLAITVVKIWAVLLCSATSQREMIICKAYQEPTMLCYAMPNTHNLPALQGSSEGRKQVLGY